MLAKIESTLQDICSSLEGKITRSLLEAFIDSLFPGGKRIRPLMCIHAYESVGGVGDKILPYACALELIHSSSLIKDDLPSMDNHSKRREKPSIWIKFGEATALMASDLLIVEACRILSDNPKVLQEVLKANLEMINGQTLDCLGVRSEEVNSQKTASLFESCFIIGGMVGGATLKQLELLREQGRKYGIRFQLRDDLVDKDGLYALNHSSCQEN